MTQHQRKNVAKYLYDLSKVLFATSVVGNLIAWRQFNVVTFILGVGGTVLCFWWAYDLDGVEE